MSATQVPLVHPETKFLSSYEFNPMNSIYVLPGIGQTTPFQKGEIEKVGRGDGSQGVKNFGRETP